MMWRAMLLFAMTASLLGAAGCSGRSHHPNVVLIVLDTVRADRFSCYGYERPTTPAMDSLAAEGVRFEKFYSNSSWTLPSHASLFTGLYPAAHRATQESFPSRMSKDPTTLAEVFDAGGYQTFGASENGIVNLRSGLARGFDTFIETFRHRHKAAAAQKRRYPNSLALEEFLQNNDRERPYFAFLNYISAHAPYEPPPIHRARFIDPSLSEREVVRTSHLKKPDHYVRGRVSAADFEVLGQLYDGELNFLDAQVADLVEVLRKDGRLDNTVILITADHGENVGDHGHYGHVFNIYNTLLHIPLIVVFPDGASKGTVRHDPAQLLDLFPTLLELCGVPHDPRPEGRDLFASGAESKQPTVMAEYYYPQQALSAFNDDTIVSHRERFESFMRRLRATQNGRYKYIWSSNGKDELYDLGVDPDETANLLEEDENHPEKLQLLGRMNDLVERFHGNTPLDPPPPVGWSVSDFPTELPNDPELLKQLRSLGYIK